MTAGFSFHAAPPAEVWTNDPNGLIFVGGRYRLFAQASASAPDFKTIGWGRWSSDDLLRWDWEGLALPPVDGISAYSGSVTRADPFEAFLTRHDPAGPMQTQWRVIGEPPLLDAAPLGPSGRNVRDPFVFEWQGGWRMLLAEPCDWSGWADDPASTLSVWVSGDKRDWQRVGTIGPWSPRGVMWEVPVLLDFGNVQALLIATVDRREGGAVSSVSYRLGRFDGSVFHPEGAPRLLDLGPDFYAACVNTVDGWPNGDRVVVGWASSWATARAMPWPGGVRGGPITLPRTLTLAGDRLVQQPIAGAIATARYTCDASGTRAIEIAGDAMTLSITLTPGTLKLERTADDPRFDWRAEHAIDADVQSIDVFIDAGLVEIFLAPAGLVATAFVAGGRLR